MRFTDEHTTSQVDSPINLTALIDVIFNLLIFFMVTTSFITSGGGIKVRLPEASSKEIADEKAEIKLSITQDGKVYLDGNPIDEEALSREFSAAYMRNAETTVILKADKKAEHGMVVKVMDLARRANLYRIAIATQKLEQ